MKRLMTFLVTALIASSIIPAGAAPSQGGFASDNVEYVGFVPTEGSTTTGVNIFGKFLVVTSWKNFSIYDISNPEAPAQLSITPFAADAASQGSPFRFENENVATNGKIMLFSQELPRDELFVYDIEDKTNPVLLANEVGMGGHTSTCILDCKYSLSSEGYIIDLRDPANPVKLEENWKTLSGEMGSIHDVEEYKPGFVLTSPISTPAQVLDVRNPVKPKLLAQIEHPAANDWLFHSGRWPNKGRDKFVILQGEQNANPRCSDATGPFMVADSTGWKKTHSMKITDTFRVANGTYQDGSPAVNGLGCSAHWFEEHPTFDDGGLVAVGYYEHGTRFLDVSSKGKITESGWFLPHGGSTSAAYWVNEEIVYAADYTRGIDILRYTGDL